MLQAVKNVNDVLGPMVVGMDPTKQQELDDVSEQCTTHACDSAIIPVLTRKGSTVGPLVMSFFCSFNVIFNVLLNQERTMNTTKSRLLCPAFDA